MGLLWKEWISIVKPLRGAFSRQATFYWFMVTMIGFTIKFDAFGVTSLARGVGLLPAYYTCMLNFFYSSAVSLEKLQLLWCQIVFNRFPGIVRINGRVIVIGDGIKVPKEGEKMPGVKQLHQSSGSNSKPEYIMGHSIQALCALAQKGATYFAVPLTAEIHEGIRLHWKKCQTLLEKLFDMLVKIKIPDACYLVLDKYYASGAFIKKLLNQNVHIVTMMKKNAVAYQPASSPKIKRRGRPKKYGEKIKLFELFNTLQFQNATFPDHEQLEIQYCSARFFWKPLGKSVQFVFVQHPLKGNNITMSTDLEAPALDLVTIYSLRYRIEVFFKSVTHQTGAFLYRFWVNNMKAIKRGDGDQDLQFSSREFKEKILKKMNAYHLFMQTAFISQGLLQYLSLLYPDKIFGCLGSWLRTIRKNTTPSEMIVARVLTDEYFEFLTDTHQDTAFAKFLKEKFDINRFRHHIPTRAEAA